MFKATAVWKTDLEGEFLPVGFDIDVDVEPVSTNIMPASLELMMSHIRADLCDGFIIDLGTEKKHIIKTA